MLEFDAGVWRCEVPVGRGVIGVAVALPGGDFLDEGLFVGDAPGEALGRQNAKFGSCARSSQLPCFWREVPREALDKPPGFGGREGIVERCSCRVGVEIVLDQNDCFGVCEVDIGQIPQDVSVVHGGVAIGDFDMAPQPSSGANSMNRLAVPLRSYS